MVEGILKSWHEYPVDSHFPIQNIPFGAFIHPKHGDHRVATVCGYWLMDLAEFENMGKFDGPLFSKLENKNVFKGYTNSFMELGKDYWNEARETIQNFWKAGNEPDQETKDRILMRNTEAKMTVPAKIGDYTDFYSSKNHAYNVGVMFRGPDNALQPNWLHLPVGYHGRASTVKVSDTEVRRPKGQITTDRVNPKWSKCNKLDIEVEMAIYVGQKNELGHPIKVKNAGDHIFGYSILNDWSARDLQVWEYVPLGPFNAKNFISTVSPWIVTSAALEPFKVQLPAQDPVPMDYLKDESLTSYNIDLSFLLKTPTMEKHHEVAKTNMKYLYWSPAQQLAHHSVTGCEMNAGDMLGTGTISGTEKSEYGSMLELTWNGKEKIPLPNGEERVFLEDGDEVVLRGQCNGNGFVIGFGDCMGKITPALDDSEYF
jgi:fumarylacetoacetase